MSVPSVFTYLVGISGTAMVEFKVSGVSIVGNTSFSDWDANVTLYQSKIGSVFTFGTSRLLRKLDTPLRRDI